MHIAVVGVNHQTAPVAIREKVAISADKIPEALARLTSSVAQGLILSTCNRTEIYSVDGDSDRAAEASLAFLRGRLNGLGAELDKYIYILKDDAAVEHLYHLTSGLDSMIIGEYEILGQVGTALEAAEKAKVLDVSLRYVFQGAIRTGRRVREETGISKNAMSVSSVAVDLAVKTIGDLSTSRMAVIGIGEAGRLVAKAAKERGVPEIVVASRTFDTAAEFADKLGGRAVSLERLGEELQYCNLVVSCASSPHHIVDASRVESVMQMRPDRPLVIIDIGMPRNVEPSASKVKNVFLYNIDDLTQISDANRQQRAREMKLAKVIVDDEMCRFKEWRKTLAVSPTVRALMQKAEDIRTTQLEKTLKKLPPLSAEERESLEAMTKSIVTKLLKDPVDYLKANGHNNQEYLAALHEMFQLDAGKRA